MQIDMLKSWYVNLENIMLQKQWKINQVHLQYVLVKNSVPFIAAALVIAFDSSWASCSWTMVNIIRV